MQTFRFRLRLKRIFAAGVAAAARGQTLDPIKGELLPKITGLIPQQQSRSNVEPSAFIFSLTGCL